MFGVKNVLGHVLDDNWLPRDEMMRPYGYRVPDPAMFASELIDSTSAT